MFGLGIPELIVIFLVILLLFGGKNLPEIAKGLGKGIREFKGEMNNMQKEDSVLEDNAPSDQKKNNA